MTPAGRPLPGHPRPGRNPTGITTTRGTASQHVADTYDGFDRPTAACIGA